jgi:ABC-type bacteriocin/lantibiotic exporter with double-glycine peptidase domain
MEKLNKVLDKPQEEERVSEVYSDNLLTNSIDIKIENLSFHYNDNRQVISNLTLHIPAGEKVCLMGAEGSGKSTLLMLLAGIYHDFSGNILFNNVPIKMIPRTELYKKVAVSMADEELFSGTLQENITIGNKSISLSELQQICAIVGLNDYIRNLQDGYQSFLDPQGRKLSYNIVQKILLARCLVNKPSLLLLEDDWSGIEASVREKVINYLTDASHEFTMIVVTNDEVLAGLCSRIIHFEKGSVKKSKI